MDKVNLKNMMFIILSFILVFNLLLIGEANAETYYISPTGGGTTCSDGSPCSTIYVLGTGGQAGAGDNVIVKTGIYTGSNYVLNIDVSGSVGSPLVIKGENDDASPYGVNVPIFDGSNARIPCKMAGESYINLSGVICQNSSQDVIFITGNSHNINIKRVSGYNASIAGNYHIFSIWNSYNVLLEDVAASGSGRTMMTVLSSDNVVVRRFWSKFMNYNGIGGDPANLQIYRSDDAIVENSIGTQDQSSERIVTGFITWANTGSNHADRNKWYGNISYKLKGWGYWVGADEGNFADDNKFYNNVSIADKYGFFQRADSNLVIENQTIVNISKSGFWATKYPTYTGAMNTTLKNSVLLGIGASTALVNSNSTLFSMQYNNFHNNNTNYTGDFSQVTGNLLIPTIYDISTYGKGAYLVKPSNLSERGESNRYMGAQVLYQYQNGILHDGRDGRSGPDHLWPWPMEDRICKETGNSVTYENGYTGCTKGGGLWKSSDAVDAAYSADQIPLCSDGIDNDGDGTIDMSDLGCSASEDNTESSDSNSSENYNYILKVDPMGTFIDAENFTGTITQGMLAFLKESDEMDYAGTGYITPIGASNYDCSKANEGKEYKVDFENTGTYSIWIRGYGFDASSDSAFVGVDGKCLGAFHPEMIHNQWVWTNSSTGVNTFDITSPGIHTINIWLRETDFKIDGIYLTMGTEAPSDDTSSLDSIPPATPSGLMAW